MDEKKRAKRHKKWDFVTKVFRKGPRGPRKAEAIEKNILKQLDSDLGKDFGTKEAMVVTAEDVGEISKDFFPEEEK